MPLMEIIGSLAEKFDKQTVEIGYKDIKPETAITVKEAKDYINSLFDNTSSRFVDVKNDQFSDVGKDSDIKEQYEAKGCPIEGNGGTWSGERGNSNWIPDRLDVPENPKTNPDGLTRGEIFDKYGIDRICFKDGEPDFSEVSKGKVEIDDFTDARDANFDQADEKLAEQRGCTPEEVEKWRKENGYTWHECRDCKTMQMVPTEVNGNIPHRGGISEYKSQKNRS